MSLNPQKRNKVDVQSLPPDEQRLFRLYGKLPSRSDHFAKHLKDRKYFDSGDYAMSQAGKGDGVDAGAVGSQHPDPQKIPHLSSPATTGGSGGSAVTKHTHSSIAGAQAGSPVKESSFLHRETSAEGEIITAQKRDDVDAPPTAPSALASQAVVADTQ